MSTTTTLHDPAHPLDRSTTFSTARLLAPLGRGLYSAIFIQASIGHFMPPTIVYAAQNGVPMPDTLVPLSGVLALLGGLSVLLGFHAKVGAWLLVAFLVPVTVMMHPFWTLTDPTMRGIQQGMFFKNLSMLGAAFLIIHFGAGPVSIDSIRGRHHRRNF